MAVTTLSENQLYNGGFEKLDPVTGFPKLWQEKGGTEATVFVVSTAASTFVEGQQSLEILNPTARAAGVIQCKLAALPVNPGEAWQIGAWMATDAANLKLFISVHFLNNKGQRVLLNTVCFSSTTEFRQFTGEFTVPAQGTFLQVEVGIQDAGMVFIDHVTARKAYLPDPETRAVIKSDEGLLFSGTATVDAAAGQFFGMQLFNPPDSQVNLYIQRIILTSTVDTLIVASLGGTLGPTQLAGTRQTLNTRYTASMVRGQAFVAPPAQPTVAGDAIAYVQLLRTEILPLNGEAIIEPGDNLTLSATLDAAARVTGAVHWWEEPLPQAISRVNPGPCPTC